MSEVEIARKLAGVLEDQGCLELEVSGVISESHPHLDFDTGTLLLEDIEGNPHDVKDDLVEILEDFGIEVNLGFEEDLENEHSVFLDAFVSLQEGVTTFYVKHIHPDLSFPSDPV